MKSWTSAHVFESPTVTVIKTCAGHKGTSQELTTHDLLSKHFILGAWETGLTAPTSRACYED